MSKHERGKNLVIDIEPGEPAKRPLLAKRDVPPKRANANKLKTETAPECCIYRVPKVLSEINESAYVPKIISIGPFHHNSRPKLHKGTGTDMEQNKKMYQGALFERPEFAMPKNGSPFDVFLAIVKENQNDIKACYEEPIGFVGTDDEFAEMIVLDSAFIIEFFLRENELVKKLREEADFKPWLRFAIQRDLLLLENQIPYFILKKLYCSAFRACTNDIDRYPSFEALTKTCFRGIRHVGANEDSSCLSMCCSCDECWSFLYCFPVANFFSRLEQCIGFFWTTNCSSGISAENDNKKNKEEFKHFIDFFRSERFYAYPDKGKCNLKGQPYLKNSATNLHHAGVRFKPSGVVDFKHGVLEIPTFQVDDDTEGIIRNLMAFEQCHYPDDPYICDYIAFMDFLVNDKDDVKLLVENDVIINLLGDNEMVAKFINNLCLGITTGDTYKSLNARLDKHCRNWWYASVAIMRRSYFSNLWKGTGTIAALLVLCFTLIISINSIIQIFLRD